MFSIASFVVSNADGTSPTTVTITATDISLGGPTIPIPTLPDFIDACRQLLDQDRADGEITETIRVTGGPLVAFALGADPSLDTVKPHASLATPWSRAKIDGGLLAALDALTLAGLL